MTNKREFAPETMTKAERSCIVYVESMAVDYGGMLEAQRMDEHDLAALKLYKEAGLLDFGRIPARLLDKSPPGKKNTHWAVLTNSGWALAQSCRQFRAFQTNWNNPNYCKSSPFANAVHKAVRERADNGQPTA